MMRFIHLNRDSVPRVPGQGLKVLLDRGLQGACRAPVQLAVPEERDCAPGYANRFPEHLRPPDELVRSAVTSKQRVVAGSRGLVEGLKVLWPPDGNASCTREVRLHLFRLEEELLRILVRRDGDDIEDARVRDLLAPLDCFLQVRTAEMVAQDGHGAHPGDTCEERFRVLLPG